MVGMSRRRRPKFQLRSSVHAGDTKAALPCKSVSGGLRLVAYASESAPTLPFDARARGVALFIDEVAARVSYTVETTVLPSFALPRGSCSGVSMSAGWRRARFGRFGVQEWVCVFRREIGVKATETTGVA